MKIQTRKRRRIGKQTRRRISKLIGCWWRQRGGSDTTVPITYFILTASLIQNGNEKRREQQYKEGIKALKTALDEFPGLRSKIYIVENNGKRPTFLDSLGADRVIYTDNNKSPDGNKGNKELRDVQEVITQQQIGDSDFVVKLTGRYKIKTGSAFMKAVAERSPAIDAIVRYGSFMTERVPPTKVADAITGLIGLKAKYIKQIPFQTGPPSRPIEWNWGKVIMGLPDERVIALKELGVEMSVADGEPIQR